MIARQTTRMRAQARTGDENGPITASGPINENWVVREMGGGETLFATSAAVTPEVPTNGIVDVELSMQNAAVSVAPGDDDSCSLGALRSGIEYEVTADPSWTSSESITNCLKTLSEVTHEFSFTAPSEPGSETLDITIEGTGTGFTGGGSFSVAVTDSGGDDEDGSEFPGDNDNSIRPGPGDGRDDGGGTLPGGDNGGGIPALPEIGTTQAIAIGGGFTLLLVLALALR